MPALTDLKRRAPCVKCGHQRYMHEYELGGKITLGPCRSNPKEGVEPLIKHICGCTHQRFEAVKERIGQ